MSNQGPKKNEAVLEEQDPFVQLWEKEKTKYTLKDISDSGEKPNPLALIAQATKEARKKFKPD